MKVSDQIKPIRSEMQVIHHRLFNDAVNEIIQSIEADVPGLRLHYSGKTLTNTGITASISGEVEDPDGEKKKQLDLAVAKIVNSGSDVR